MYDFLFSLVLSFFFCVLHRGRGVWMGGLIVVWEKYSFLYGMRLLGCDEGVRGVRR